MPEPDSEQLLKMLDTELARSRSKREDLDSRDSFRIWSLVFIIGGAIVALVILQLILSQMAPPHPAPPASSQGHHR